MPISTEPIEQLVCRARDGDQAAACELHETYGPHLLRAIRRRLRPIVRPVIDSIDIAQIVWCDFFAKIVQRQNFDSPGHLIAFLTRMGENTVSNVHRQYLDTESRDLHRQLSLHGDEEPPEFADPSMDPAVIASMRDDWNHLLAISSDRFQEVVRRLLKGELLAGICGELHLHERTIRRILLDPRLGLPTC